MEIISDYKNLKPAQTGAVLAIGNFDGVHKGHQALLQKVREIADKAGAKTGILTFEPHPRRLFRPDDPPFRLTPWRLKCEQLKRQGIDLVYCLPFDWDFASQTAPQFIEAILTQGLKPAHIVIGADFRFGQMRQGTPDDLRQAGFNVTVFDKVTGAESEEISASRIRQALRHGDIDTANRLLGWPWEIAGTVVKGDQRGRQLGYPTANVQMGETLHPDYGIYASMTRIAEDGADSLWLPSVTNIGIRPMFEVPVGQMETYIFDFDRDIYGKTLHVRPVKRLRGEARFDNIDALIRQIGEDCLAARKILAP
jgi:riboflavin kinase / FMN adenylyltransferase